MAKKDRKFKKSEVKLDEVNKIAEDQEKVNQLKEKYVTEIVALRESITAMFKEFEQYGKKINMETIADEIDALPPMEQENIAKIAELCESRFEISEEMEGAYMDYNFYPMAKRAHQWETSNIIMNTVRAAINYGNTEEEKYQFFKKRFLPKEVLEFEKKTGFDIVELKRIVKLYEEKVELFYDLYEKILAIDDRSEVLKGASKVEVSNFVDIAKSFLFNPFGIFGDISAKKSIDPEIKTKEEQQSSDSKSQSNEGQASSWWNIKLDFGFWSSSKETQQPLSPDDQDFSDVENNINQEESVKPGGKVPFHDQSVINGLHDGYQKVVEYGIEVAKAQCFASATAESMRVTAQCISKRTDAAHNHYYKSSEEVELNDDNSSESVDEQMSTAVSVVGSSSSLVAAGAVSSIEEVVNECHNLAEQAKNMADNCNYMFGMATSIDEAVTNGLKRAVSIEAEVQEGQAILNANGIEIMFYQVSNPERSADEMLQLSFSESVESLPMSGQDGDATLAIGQ